MAYVPSTEEKGADRPRGIGAVEKCNCCVAGEIDRGRDCIGWIDREREGLK